LCVFPTFPICINRLPTHESGYEDLSFTANSFSLQSNPKQQLSLLSELFVVFRIKLPDFREFSHKKVEKTRYRFSDKKNPRIPGIAGIKKN